MSIHISTSLVLLAASPTGLPGGVTLDHPVIGYHNVVTASTIVATAEAASYPASNLANPATHLEWRGTTPGEQYLTITTNEVDPIDYIGIARHNWATAEIAVSVEGFIDGVWENIVDEFMPATDGPLLLRFEAQSLSDVRIKLAAGSVIPRAAVVYCGELLILERKIYVGHTPLPHARKFNIVNGRSESGNFLGRIVTGETRETTVPLSLISPAWYREYMDPFLAVADETPFFFGWRPEIYPAEIGFGWLLDEPMPVPTGPSNLIAFDLSVGGIV